MMNFKNLILLALINLGLFNNNVIYLDAPLPWQIGFQDGGSPSFEGITALHDTIMFYLILILIAVFWVLTSLIVYFNSEKSKVTYKYLNHGTVLELIWTITPSFILIAIAYPSFTLLYTLDEVIDPALTVKVTGNQWFWSFEYSDIITGSGEAIEFDSYMIPESDLELGQLRLLDVDNKLKLPVNTHVRFIITGADVIHNFGIPSLGIKVDGVPGRLNQTSVLIERVGNFYGQCSEICGVWHGFMPINIESVVTSDFFAWADSN